MPTYVYACRACDTRLEAFQKITDDPLTECGECGGALRRVLFPPVVVYKGSGFYTTDYKKSPHTGGGEPNGGRRSDSESGSSGSNNKAEATAEANLPTQVGVNRGMNQQT